MRFTLLVLMVSSLFLSACGGSFRDSRLNPSNWFGRSTSQPAPGTGTATSADGRAEEEVNPLIGERKQSQLIAANRRSTGASGSIFDRDKKEGPYLGTRVARVTDLVVEPTSTGAIVRVTGLSGRQGAFDVRLLPVDDSQPRDGVMTYEFLALQPINTPVGPERARLLQVARKVGAEDLEQIRTIRVLARTNMRTTRR